MSLSWKWLAMAVVLAAVVLSVSADYPEGFDRIRFILAKRKPSIGLSLAEYMAEGGKGDNFHFLPSRRSE